MSTLPHNLDAEASILGGILLRNEVLALVDSLEVDDFYDHKHKVVFQAIRNLTDRHVPVDVVTLENEIIKSGRMEAIGGVAFLGELTLRVPTTDNVVAYAEIVRKHHMVRATMVAASEIAEGGYRHVDDPDEYVSESIGELQAIERRFRDQGTKMPPGFATMATRVAGERQDRLDAAGRGLQFHNSYLDDRLRMILPHDLVIVTAKSGVGKTEFALSLAMANALNRRQVGYFALEAEPRELERRTKYRWLVDHLYQRELPGRERMDFTDWLIGRCEHLTGKLDAEADAWFGDRLRTFWTFYKGIKKFDAAAMATEMLSISRRVDLITLDHLHYIDGKDGEQENRLLARVAHTLRDIALGVGKPVIAVAHLRKRQGPERTLLPDQEEIMGPSDLFKITTQIIALGPAHFIESPKWWLAPTLISVIKDRRDSNDHLAALVMFDKRRRTYASSYTLGRLTKNCTEWEELKGGDVPGWARGHRPLEMEIAA